MNACESSCWARTIPRGSARARPRWRRGRGALGALQLGDEACPELIDLHARSFALRSRFGYPATWFRYGYLMPGSEDEAVALVDAYLERATGAQARERLRCAVSSSS